MADRRQVFLGELFMADLRESCSYYDQKSKDYLRNLGEELFNEVLKEITFISENPFQFPVLEKDARIRICVLQKFPFTILFRLLTEDTVEIVTLAHHSRDPKTWFRSS